LEHAVAYSFEDNDRKRVQDNFRAQMEGIPKPGGKGGAAKAAAEKGPKMPTADRPLFVSRLFGRRT